MSKNETDRATTEEACEGSTFQSFLAEDGIAEKVNEIALARVSEWQESQHDATLYENTSLTDEDEAFFSRMPPEIFAELSRRAELAKSSAGIAVHEFRRLVERERMELKAAALQGDSLGSPDV